MKEAIILAAGVGERLRPLTNTVPKYCVPVGGQMLLGRLIGQFQKIDPDMRIHVAAGYLADIVRQVVAPYGAVINVVENPDFATTNNMESCRRVLEHIEMNGNILIINGDCIYADIVVEKIVQSDGNCIGVDSTEYYDESMKVRIKDGLIVDIAKTLPNKPDCITSIDFYNFMAPTARALYEIM